MKKSFAAAVAALLALSMTACTKPAEPEKEYRQTQSVQQIFSEGELMVETRNEYTYDEKGTTTYSYTDGVLSVVQVPGETDENGQLLTILYQNAEGVTQGMSRFTYDDRGYVVKSEMLEGDQVTQSNENTYDDQGNRIRTVILVHATGMEMVIDYTYDDQGNEIAQTTAMDGKVSGKRTKEYDDNGRLLRETVYQSGDDETGKVTEYTYDPESRTLSGICGTEKIIITYDEAGNQICQETFINEVISTRLTTEWEEVPAQ